MTIETLADTMPHVIASGTAVVPVILSGGSGSRLWPVSRESFPKQYWPLMSERTLIQETVLRAHGAGCAPPILVCNQEHRFLVAEQVRGAGVEHARIVLEPMGRNSAPAIAAAALLVAETDPDAVLWMMAADSAIENVAALQVALASAVAAARAGRIVTFGMKPTSAETGYGYIEVGDRLPGLEGVHALTRFVEKPDAATAARLAGSGNYLWNSGMFVFTAATLLREMAAHAPAVLDAMRASVAARHDDRDFIRLGVAESPPARTSASTTRSPSAPATPRWCPPISAGPMSAAGARCGNSAPRTRRATWRSATCCWKAPPIATPAATVSSPRWSA